MYINSSLSRFIGNLPLPPGCTESRILDEPRLRQFLEVLPAKAEGYPWRRIYSSFDHGFSLRTLYRKMADFGDELSPVVGVIFKFNLKCFIGYERKISRSQQLKRRSTVLTSFSEQCTISSEHKSNQSQNTQN